MGFVGRKGAGQQALLYAPDSNSIASILKVVKKQKLHFQITMGKIDDRLYTPEQLVAYTKMPSLDQLRSETVQILSTPSTRLAGLLSSNTATLSRLLTSHAEGGSGS